MAMDERLITEGVALPQTFAGVPPEFARWESASVALLPVPYDLTTSYQAGARRGPQAILEASLYLEHFDEELGTEPYRIGVCTLPSLEPQAAGPEAMLERIERTVDEIWHNEKFPIVLGGDHAITVGVVRALAKRHKRFSVLQLDAHADLRDTYQGTKWSHACVARRIVELGGKLIQIGIRSLSSGDAAFIEQASIPTIYSHECWRDPRAAEGALASLEDPVYITLDVDVFDPSVVPATGTPEPGGLDWYTILTILRRVFERHQVIGCDVVELSPIPGMVAPDFLVAKLVYKLISYWGFQQRQGG
jgi:agmatinase